MESTNNDQQTPPAVSTSNNNNSSSRRKQSKPNRLEHVVIDTPAAAAAASVATSVSDSTVSPAMTQYHVAAEQQESGLGDDDSDQISLNCEDGSSSSNSPRAYHPSGEHYAMEDIINRSRRPHHTSPHSSRSAIVTTTHADENVETMGIDDDEQQQTQQTSGVDDDETAAVLDFSLKIDAANGRPSNSTVKTSHNRSRSIGNSGKPRTLKRKHTNGSSDNAPMPPRIFHADAFCNICRKEFCNKYFLKTHLANKHGIFDHQSIVPPGSSSSVPSLLNSPTGTPTDTNMNSSNNAGVQHPFTVISTLLHNGHDDLSSSPPSPSSGLMHDQPTNDEDDDNELGSLRQAMNGVVAGDDDEDDDEQDGTNTNGTNAMMSLPQQMVAMLCNGSPTAAAAAAVAAAAVSMMQDENDREVTANSPTNSLDFQQQALPQPSSAPSSLLTPNVSGTSSSSSTTPTTTNPSRQSSAKLPEDFCDICQKHFCNKYYLRKHKLDVHGVQTDCNIKPYKRIDSGVAGGGLKASSPPASQVSPAIQLPPSFSNVTFNSSSVQQSLGMLLNPIFSPLVQQVQSPSTSSSNKRRHGHGHGHHHHPDTSNDSVQSFSSSLLSSVPSDVANVFANQLVSVNNSSTTTTSKSLSSSSSLLHQISTCHLCGKKFQSNDYLHLHLMNKHQIGEINNLTNPTSYHSQRTIITPNNNKIGNIIKSSSSSSNDLTTTLHGGNTVKKIKLEPNETTTTTTSGTMIKTSSPSTETTTTPGTGGVQSSTSSSTIMPGIVDTYFAAKMADRVSCNICHKQVCNKYFLKTHKLKVHGVGPDPGVTTPGTTTPTPTTITSANLITPLNNESNEGSESETSIKFEQQPLSNGSPPRLIVDEMNSSNNTEPGAIPSPDALTSAVNSFITSNTTNITNESTDQQQQPVQSSSPSLSSSVTCDLCSKSFASKFLLHLHTTNVHGIQQQQPQPQQSPNPISNGTNLTIKTGKNQLGTAMKRSANGLTVRSKQTPQVQLRVTCQVCKKELCNKYFLRAHMRNVHNLSVDDLRLIQQQQQKSPSVPVEQIFSSSTNLLTNNNDLHSTKLDDSSHHLNGHSNTHDSNDETENVEHFSHKIDSSSSSSNNNKISSSPSSSSIDNNNLNTNRLLSMQPFLVESDDDLYKDLFVPCMVYLPCRHRVTKPLQISLRLKPVDNTTPTAVTAGTTASIAD